MKEKLKSYSFWVSLVSAVVLVLKVIGNRYGFTVDESTVGDISTALCSLFVILGIVVVPTVKVNNQHNISNDTTKDGKQAPNLEDSNVIVKPNDSANNSVFVAPVIEKTFTDLNMKNENSLNEISCVAKQVEDNETTLCENQNVIEVQNLNQNDNSNKIVELVSALEKEREKFAGDINTFIDALEKEINFSKKIVE